jgi:hypothetical protein
MTCALSCVSVSALLRGNHHLPQQCLTLLLSLTAFQRITQNRGLSLGKARVFIQFGFTVIQAVPLNICSGHLLGPSPLFFQNGVEIQEIESTP